MLDYHAASDRAVRFAIQTGDMPNMNLIHALQRSEGFEACFGRATSQCDRSHCRWHQSCMALFSYDPDGLTRSLESTVVQEGETKAIPLTVLGIGPMKPAEGEKVVPVRRRMPKRRQPRTAPETIKH